MTSQSGPDYLSKRDDLRKRDETIKVKSIHRYPVKGLSGEDLAKVTCDVGQPLPFDRVYAIENGPTRFNPKDPKHLSKINFLALMKQERLALLKTEFDEETQTLTIFREGRQVAKGNLSTIIGRNMIEQFIAAFMREELKGPPKIVSAPNHHFADCPEPLVHIITTGSTKALGHILNDKIDARRFRANIVLETQTPWEEKNWLGKVLQMGDVKIKIIDETTRCAAINVDLETGKRGRSIAAILTQHFNNENFGLYGKIIEGGRLSLNQPVSICT